MEVDPRVPRELHEPIGKEGMRMLATDTYCWLTKPKPQGAKFGFIDVAKIIVVVLAISGIAYFVWWLWRQLAQAFGGAL